jgi:hypothetical protein
LRYRHLLTICILVLMMAFLVLSQGCKKAEANDDSAAEQAVATAAASAGDDPTEFFIGLEDRLTEMALASIAIVEISDPKGNDPHKIRNVRQATLGELSQMIDIAVRDVSDRRVASVMQSVEGDSLTGLDPEDVMDIGIKLGVDALLFGSIESKKNDVFFWAYSAMNGDIIFSDTLKKWELPVSDGLDSLFDFDFGDEGSVMEETESASETAEG